MVNTPSVSGQEGEIASLLKKKMTELGYDTVIDEAGNVVGQLGIGSPHVLLCGHMDTVPGDLPISHQNGVLTGRGSVDAKGPLASLIIGGYQAYRNGFKGTIIVAAVVDEEGQNKGVKEIIRKGMKVDYAVFGEPSNVNSITVGYKGAFSVRIKLITEAGHSSAPWMYTNAIDAAMDLYNIIKKTVVNMTDANQGIDALTITLRSIHGGKGFGSIPNECEILIGIRIPFGIKSQNIIQLVKDQVSGYNSINPKIRICFTVLDQVEPFLADKKSMIVKAFSRVIYSYSNDSVKLVRKSGTGDMNYYGNATKTPCITYGPGDPHLDHTDNEQIKIEDYLDSINIISNALLTLEKLL